MAQCLKYLLCIHEDLSSDIWNSYKRADIVNVPVTLAVEDRTRIPEDLCAASIHSPLALGSTRYTVSENNGAINLQLPYVNVLTQCTYTDKRVCVYV